MISPQLPVTLFGFHGQRSTGDDALACAISYGLWRRFGCERYYIPAETVNLPVLPSPCRAVAPLAWMKRGRYRNDWRLKFSVRESEIFLLAGGAILHEKNDYEGLSRLVDSARKHNRIVGGIGVSLGPFSSIKQYEACAGFLAKLDFITLRGFISHEIATSYTLPYEPLRTLDLAITLQDVFALSRSESECRSGEVRLGLAICDHHRLTLQDTSEDIRRRQAAVDTVKALAKNIDLKVTLFEFSGHPTAGDRPTIDALNTALRDHVDVDIQHYHRDPSRMWRRIASMDVMVAMRYHANIFSYAAGVPFVMLDYHPKCTGMAADVGIPLELILDAHDLDPVALEKSILLALSPDCPKPLVSPREALELAEKNFAPLEALLGRNVESVR